MLRWPIRAVTSKATRYSGIRKGPCVYLRGTHKKEKQFRLQMELQSLCSKNSRFAVLVGGIRARESSAKLNDFKEPDQKISSPRLHREDALKHL